MAQHFYHIRIIPALFLLALGITACLPSRWTGQQPPDLADQDACHFHVVSHGYHTSLVLPLESRIHNWQAKFPELPDSKYLAVAWGDSAFYRAKGQPVGQGLKAALWPTPSVMHVVSFNQHPDQYFADDKVYALAANPSNYQAMLTFIRQSFDASPKGHWQYLGKGRYGTSGFYQSSRTYHGFYNCNNWVTTALKKAGQQAPLWGGFPFMATLYL